jgi:molybdopterin-binding protein
MNEHAVGETKVESHPSLQSSLSIITASSAREMNLKKGQTAAALIKSTEVMIIRV